MASRSTGLALGLATLAALLAVGLVVVFDQVDHLALFVLVFVLLLLGVVPIGIQLSRGKMDLFEAIHPYWAISFLYFGVGAVFTLFVKTVAYDVGVFQYLDLAVAYCVLGYACALVGYYATGSFVPPRLAGPGPSLGWLGAAVLYLVGNAGQLMFAIMERIPAKIRILFLTGGTSLLSQLDFLAYFTLFYVLYLVFARKAPASFKVLLYGLMLPTQLFSLFLRFGNKTPLFLTIGMPILAYWYARRKLAWKTITVVVLISVFFVFPLYYTVRNYKSAYYSQKYRIERTFESMTSERPDVFAQDALRTTARRLAIVNSTAVIIRECGRRVDYALGRTLWLGVISASIPRFLWPNKPSTAIGIEIGRTFHVTTFGSYSMIAPSQAGELYWNFHVPGIVIGMFLIGLWLRVMYLRFGANQGSNPLRLAMYVTLLYTTVMGLDGGLGTLEGGLFKEVVILLGVEKALILMESISRQPSEVAERDPALAVP